jgi:hypothetical protein
MKPLPTRVATRKSLILMTHLARGCLTPLRVGKVRMVITIRSHPEREVKTISFRTIMNWISMLNEVNNN